ncbi:phosphoribosylanthranilate isomerase [Streptococcus suis]|nr:phosphoribosylanthranilate isomerase [Streptococcus suis]
MTKVKICGLSTKEAVYAAVEAGADYIGFVFAPSKRRVSFEKAHELAQLISPTVKIVGVFVQPSLKELEAAISVVPLDLIQIHGNWDECLSHHISVPIIRAIQLDNTLGELNTNADYLLFDAPKAGSGQLFDWKLLAHHNIEKPFFIAGGLTVDNVAEAQSLFTPYAVDVSSGVETNGQKDVEKIKAFIERVKL